MKDKYKHLKNVECKNCERKKCLFLTQNKIYIVEVMDCMCLKWDDSTFDAVFDKGNFQWIEILLILDYF
jgi:hypothetical protein